MNYNMNQSVNTGNNKALINKEVKEFIEKVEEEIWKKINIELLVEKMAGKQLLKRRSADIASLIDSCEQTLFTVTDLKDTILAEHKESLKEYIEEIKVSLENLKTNNYVNGLKQVEEAAEKSYDLVSFIENAKERIINSIVEEATAKIEVQQPAQRSITVYKNNAVTKLPEQLYHSEFENIFKLVDLKIPVMLIGPTGSGKSVCVKQVADALDLDFYYTNNVSEEYKMLGFTDAHGIYKETQFYKAFKDGGLFFLDEMDSSHPSALLSINSAIGSMQNNGSYMAFEDGKVTKAHKNFRLVAAANTYGNGANRLYCGRNELDAASLNRFIQIYFNYDPKLERSLVDDYELLSFFWNYREAIDNIGIRQTVGTRNIIYANELSKQGFSNEQILQYTAIQHLDGDDVRLILKQFEQNGKDIKSPYVKTLTKLSVGNI